MAALLHVQGILLDILVVVCHLLDQMVKYNKDTYKSNLLHIIHPQTNRHSYSVTGIMMTDMVTIFHGRTIPHSMIIYQSVNYIVPNMLGKDVY